MNFNPKMLLKHKDKVEAQSVYHKAVSHFLHPANQKNNVVGMGIGVKWVNGQPTGEPALIVFVREKVPLGELSMTDAIPQTLSGMQTDVLAIGAPQALKLTNRIRPVRGGFSVGHPSISAGTLGCSVYERSDLPNRYYLLSNNHVLANSNKATIGDPILQPASADGGSQPEDVVGPLARFVEIELEPPISRDQQQNKVDAAIAEVDMAEVERSIHWVGDIRGWRRANDVEVGTPVQKTGRTTGFTLGRVTAIQSTVDVHFDHNQVARFHDQLMLTPMSEGGDSGSLITTHDNVALGLLFAGSSQATIANPIEYVCRELDIEISPNIL